MKRIALVSFVFMIVFFAISCNHKPAGLTDAELKDTIQKAFTVQLNEIFAGRAQIQELHIDTVTPATDHDFMEVVTKQVSNFAQAYDTVQLQYLPEQYRHQVDSMKGVSKHLVDSFQTELAKKDNTDKKLFKVHFTVKVMTGGGPQTISENTFLDKNYKIIK